MRGKTETSQNEDRARKTEGEGAKLDYCRSSCNDRGRNVGMMKSHVHDRVHGEYQGGSDLLKPVEMCTTSGLDTTDNEILNNLSNTPSAPKSAAALTQMHPVQRDHVRHIRSDDMSQEQAVPVTKISVVEASGRGVDREYR